MFVVENLKKILVCLIFLCGGCMATDYSKNGIRSMDDARAFRDLSQREQLSNQYIDNTIDATISYFNSISPKRLDRAVALIWKLESLCGETHLKAYSNTQIERLVDMLTNQTTADPEKKFFDIRFAQVLWASQFTDLGTALRDNVEACVIQKIGFLLTGKTIPETITLKSSIKETLKIADYEDFITYIG
jgi:hypothetical protein